MTSSSQIRRHHQTTTNTTTTTASQMPKLLHALCCCLRPNPLNEKNDSRSSTCVNTNNNVYDSSRGILQPISKLDHL
uniref:Uncharacterized protein n=1 Tax=Meloidogyne enterolobii TaxID=390850 RepID=A0A6V7TQ43_MELEN|nr:unnamed protein product [Meloidogyne enterolobii]